MLLSVRFANLIRPQKHFYVCCPAGSSSGIDVDSFHAGDGKDEEVAAKTMNFPFWRISAHSDLIAFYNALDMGFM